MLDVLLIVLGLAMVLLTFLDAFMTTLAVSAGAGPVTSRVLAVTWRSLLALHHGGGRSSVLTGAGTVLLMMTVLLWVAGLWLGWTLVFLGAETVVSSPAGRSAGPTDVVYFSGLTVFTLGTGDFVASSPGWRLVSALASFTGLFLVTLAITYLISVVSAVVARRSLAIQIHGLGQTSTGIVSRGWTGEGFSSLFEQQLVQVSTSLIHSAEQHLAYPVLHYFHASQRDLSSPSGVAELDDALYLMREGLPEDKRPDESATAALRHAVDRYITTETGIAWLPPAEVPPAPPLEELQRHGVPVVSEQSFHEALVDERGRRTMLHRLVISDGWTWPGEPSR